jgi:hypothetical protein
LANTRTWPRKPAAVVVQVAAQLVGLAQHFAGVVQEGFSRGVRRTPRASR